MIYTALGLHKSPFFWPVLIPGRDWYYLRQPIKLSLICGMLIKPHWTLVLYFMSVSPIRSSGTFSRPHFRHIQDFMGEDFGFFSVSLSLTRFLSSADRPVSKIRVLILLTFTGVAMCPHVSLWLLASVRHSSLASLTTSYVVDDCSQATRTFPLPWYPLISESPSSFINSKRGCRCEMNFVSLPLYIFFLFFPC